MSRYHHRHASKVIVLSQFEEIHYLIDVYYQNGVPPLFRLNGHRMELSMVSLHSTFKTRILWTARLRTHDGICIYTKKKKN